MSELDERCASLRAQIAATEAQLAGLKQELASAQEAATAESNSADLSDSQQARSKSASRWPLLQEEYKRYGRQMIVSQVGLEGEFHSSDMGLCGNIDPKLLTWRPFHPSRPTEAACIQGSSSRGRWSWMSCGTVPCWRGCGYTRPDRRRHGRCFESTSPGSTPQPQCGKIQGG